MTTDPSSHGLRFGDNTAIDSTNMAVGNSGPTAQNSGSGMQYNYFGPKSAIPWFQTPPLVPELVDDPAFLTLHPLAAALHLAAVLPTTILPTPSPLRAPESYLPYRSVPNFVGRAEELQAIAQTFHEGSAAAVVPSITTGAMGVGKTSLALEFAYRYGRYFAGGVFWVDCAEATQVTKSIVQSGLYLKLYTQIDDLAQAVQMVLRAWQEPIPRLLIFDNCDDPAIVEQYAPTGGGCRVLVTTRYTQWSWPTIHVGVLPRVESITMLQQLVPSLTESEADFLAAFVGDLPLGLRLVGCYLRTYPQDAQAYRASLDVHHRSLTDRGVIQPNTDLPARTENNLLLIVQAAVATLTGNDLVSTLARQGLDILCHLAPGEPIPDAFLIACLGEAVNSDDATDALYRLRNVGLLDSRGEGQQTIHRLLHTLLVPAYATVAGYERVQRAVASAVEVVVKAGYPFAEPWLLPHAEVVIYSPWAMKERVVAEILNNVANLYESQGRYGDAEPLYQQALNICESELGIGYATITTVLNNVANLYESQGRYEDAEPLYERALNICESKLGPDHLSTAQVLNNLAHLRYVQGRYGEAKPLYQRALEIRKVVLGSNHPATATILNNVANLYESQGRYREAEPLLIQALTIHETARGKNHPSTATSLNNLAALYESQGRYGEAKPLYQRALEIRETTLGIGHLGTATSLNNLANLYFVQEQYAETEPLLIRALDIYKAVLGVNHPSTAKSLNNLASLYTGQRRYEEAEALLIQALAIYEAVLGVNHPSTAKSLNNLAMVYELQGRYEDAGPLYGRALLIYDVVLGADHPSTIEVRKNLIRLREGNR